MVSALRSRCEGVNVQWRVKWIWQFLDLSWGEVPGPMYAWNESKPNVTTVLSVEKLVETEPWGQPLPDVWAWTMVIWLGGGDWRDSNTAAVAEARRVKRGAILMMGW
jgi:hypothetical protein